MVSINDQFPSRFLKAADLKGQPVQLVIKDFGTEKMPDGNNKACLYFRKTDKILVLNKTNANKIADIYGDETDEWIGKEVTLYPTTTEMQGREVEAIRVRINQMKAKLKSKSMKDELPDEPVSERNPPPPKSAPDDDLDDEIPF